MKIRVSYCLMVVMFLVFLPSGAALAQGQEYMYFVTDQYGGTEKDANKTDRFGAIDGTASDSEMCWAAAGANALAWGGWYAGGMWTEQEMLTYFVDHWTNEGGLPKDAWEWWVYGDESTRENDAKVESPGGNFWPDLGQNFDSYWNKYDEDIWDHMWQSLQDGWGVVLGIQGEGKSHVVSLWGFDYIEEEVPGVGLVRTPQLIFVTDSNDDWSGDLAWSVKWNSDANKWQLSYQQYKDYFIEEVFALAWAPPTCSRYEFQYDYANSDDYYRGYVYADDQEGYFVGQVIEMQDETGGTGRYTILAADQEVRGEFAFKAAQHLCEVVEYYDSENQAAVGPENIIDGVGLFGLGSERGYFVSDELPDFFFGHASGKDGFVFEADPLERYYYTYHYENGQGDWYIGSIWVRSDWDFTWLESQTFTDEHGNTGFYEVRDLVGFSWDASKLNQVTVTAYYNSENSTPYTPVSVDSSEFFGHNGLGTERGYIVPFALETYYFGSKPVENPDDPGNPFWPDPHYEADLLAVLGYDLTYTVSGDQHSGTVIADLDDEDLGYLVGTTIPLQDQFGNNQGAYEIISLEGYTEEPTPGQVVVTSYFDAQSQTLFSGSQLLYGQIGTYLKSEFGRLLLMDTPSYQFGWVDGELQQADPFWRYDFTCSFESGAGDSYTGVFYDHQPYQVGQQVYPFTDENSQSGYYVVNAVELAPDGDLDGRVYVNTYRDAESGREYTPLNADQPLGTGFPGSEAGYIIQADIPDFFFGKANEVQYEADLAARFGYTFTFSNGDSYSGSVYASQWDAYLAALGKTWYQVGETWSTFCQEGLTGAYVIGPVEEYLEDTTRNGQVTVASYYDVEMKRAYVPTFFWGDPGTYLGNEYGYINITDYPEKYHPAYNFPPGINKFFFGNWDGMMYEADVKQDKKDKGEAAPPGLVAMNPADDPAPYPVGNPEKTKNQKAK